MKILDKHDIIEEIRDMEGKKGDEVESILVEEVSKNYVIVTGYNNKQTPIVIRKKIPAPNGVNEDEIYIGKKITW